MKSWELALAMALRSAEKPFLPMAALGALEKTHATDDVAQHSDDLRIVETALAGSLVGCHIAG